MLGAWIMAQARARTRRADRHRDRGEALELRSLGLVTSGPRFGSNR
jgi:hypothetical protein